VDRDQGRDIGNRKAVARNEFMSGEFMVHSFESLTNDRALRLAIFRKLLKALLKDRIGILNRARDWSKQFQFYPAIPSLDLCLFAQVAPQEVGFRLEPLHISADCNRLGKV